MLCQQCQIEMKKKEPWKKSYPMVFLCPQCGSYTIMRESGGLGWYDSNGQMFSPIVNAKELKNSLNEGSMNDPHI